MPGHRKAGSDSSAPAPRPRIPGGPRLSGAVLLLLALLAVTAILAAYSNHFRNSFHFDDATVIQNNAYLRSLKNIPLFFRDATTFSSHPSNAAYRPLTSASFALDYWRSGGLDPFAFHVTQWTLHVLLAALVFFFLRRVLELAGLVPAAGWLALFGATLFGIHRLHTETVNFLTLRSEILSTIGVVGSFVFYQSAPKWRKSLLWLLPAAAGAFAKQSAIAFAPLFAVYLLIFPDEAAVGGAEAERSRWRTCLKTALPPFALAGAFYLLQARLGGPHLIYGSTSPRVYLQTQTFAWLHYLRLFLLPLGLSADADWSPIADWFDTRVFAGVAFTLLWIGAAVFYARRRAAGKAFLFGVVWYFLSLAPSSSLFSLSEMINEHRPYFPDIGLVLCVSAAGGDVLSLGRRSVRNRRLAGAAAVLLLAAHGWGTFQRNEAWRTEESLWKSVTESSPNNGRAWMNYGLIFMARADYGNARTCFERAALLAPNYDVLEINRGILEGATAKPDAAEEHFQRALSLNPTSAMTHFYYGRWLHENRRDREAAAQLARAIAASPADLEARHLLLRVYQDLEEKDSACSLARETLRIAPDDLESAAAASGACPSL